MAQILQRFTANSGVLRGTDDGTVFLEIERLQGSALEVSVKGTVGGTGSWSTVLIEAEFSVDNGVTWIATGNTVYASTVTQDVVTSIAQVKGTRMRLIATTLTPATASPTLTLVAEVRVV